ncbi:MAG TPA: hypothetical protein PLY43_07240 [Ruminococcus sp.]|nr:hypothetical protein [Ruminococcus sp.]
MSRRKKGIPVPDPEKPDLEYVCPAASWGDMTGLIPAGSPEKDQRGAYQELYPYLPEGEIKEERDS